MKENTTYLNTDGGSRGNPGHAAIGGLAKNDNKETIFDFSEYIGVATNNVAEYSALLRGLELCLENNIKSITCRLDSELVVRQLCSIYKVKNPDIKTLYLKVKEVSKKFDSISFYHVPRSENEEADLLVNKALDKLKEPNDIY